MTTPTDPSNIPAVMAHRDLGHYEQRALVALSTAQELLQHLRAAIAEGRRTRADELAAAAGYYIDEHLEYALEGNGAIALGVRSTAHISAVQLLSILGPVEPLEEHREGRHTGPMRVVQAAQR